MSVEFPDMDRLTRAIIQSGKAGAMAAAKALRNEGQEAFAESQMEVPVDTSALKQSGRLLPDTGVYQKGNEVSVVIGYGGTALDYAIYVHEDLTAHHPHGKAKYVEDPINRQRIGIESRIADKVERVVKGMLK